jgi:hypothetical protein
MRADARTRANRQSQAGRLGGRLAAKKVPALLFGKAGKAGTPGKKAPQALPKADTAAGGTKTLMQLARHHCRWPLGERAPFRFCGKQAKQGRPYCAEHQARAYVRVRST